MEGGPQDQPAAAADRRWRRCSQSPRSGRRPRSPPVARPASSGPAASNGPFTVDVQQNDNGDAAAPGNCPNDGNDSGGSSGGSSDSSGTSSSDS